MEEDRLWQGGSEWWQAWSRWHWWARPAVSGSSGNQGNQGGKVTEGGTLRIGTSSTLDTLNPFTAFQANSILVFLYEYPYLAQYDNKNELVPSFAKSWDISADGKTVTFHLTPGATWSDGQTLDSSDVAWTYNTVVKFQNGPTSYYAGDVVDLKTVTATDPNTVEFTYSQPSSNAIALLQAIPILPEHVWGKLAAGDGKALRTYQNQPTDSQPVVSGGPFQLIEVREGPDRPDATQRQVLGNQAAHRRLRHPNLLQRRRHGHRAEVRRAGRGGDRFRPPT